MTLPFRPRFFLASVVLLAGLVTLVAVTGARRTHQELSRQLEATGLALASALEVSSRNAIRGNALMEEMIGQRLLDNARLVDELLRFRPPDPEWLRSVARTNHLLRLDLLDRQGHPYVWPAAREPAMPGMGMGMGMGMGRHHPRGHGPGPGPGPSAEERRAMMPFLWGRRWGVAPPPDPGVPPPVQDRRYWEGSVFGVAAGARSFPGIIAVHADAAYVLNFTREIGVQGQVEELGRRAGVEAVAILGPDLTVVAHSDPSRVGQRETDPGRGAGGEGPATRLVGGAGGDQALEVTRPLTLDGTRAGLLQIRLSTAPVEEAWRRGRLAAVVGGMAVLALGALGLAAIFYAQDRQLGRVRALEAEVTRRQRLATLGDMAAGVSHEIRNPLNAVSMGLQRLAAEFRPAADAEEYRRLLDLVSGEVRRLNALVEEFLTLARPPALRLEPVRLGDLLAEVAALIEPEARRAGIRVERATPADLPPVPADRDRFTQVLLNLTRNAVEAMPRGGTLRLEAAGGPRAVTLAVTDSGPGMAPEVRARAFEPYYTTKVQGLGLGLAIARQIVEAHGGTIEAQAVPGGGSCFRISLPLRPVPA